MPRLTSGGPPPSRRRINRAPSPVLAHTLPWLTILLGSMIPGWLLIASAPVMPPLGFLLFIAWRQLRPGLLPIWSALPLGLFDDLFSAIALEFVEARVPWRNFLTEWLLAIGLIVSYIVLCLGLNNLAGAGAPVRIILPQIVISVLSYPLVGRFVAVMDRLRLTPITVLR